MAQQPRTLDPHQSLRHYFGAELRGWRTRRGLSQDELGRLAFVSGDTIGKVEKAVRRPTSELAMRCDAALDTGGVLSRLSGLLATEGHIKPDGSPTPAEVAGSGTPEPTERAVGLIRLAGAAWFGLLPHDQFELSTGFPTSLEVPERVNQEHVAALRRSTSTFEEWDHRYGGGLARAAMAGQLGWACHVAGRASMTDSTRRSWQSAAARLGDLLGWACFDAGEDEAAHRFFLSALQLAGEAGDIQQRTHTATSLSRQLTYLGRTTEALELADLARLGWRQVPHLGRTAIGIVEARAYGRARDRQACMSAVSGCDENFATSRMAPDEDETWGYYADEGQILGDAGHALFDLAMSLGDRSLAAATAHRLETAYALHKPDASRSKALTMTRIACLKARFGDPSEACDAAERGISDGSHVWSRRVTDDLRLLAAVLNRIADGRADERIRQVQVKISSVLASGHSEASPALGSAAIT